MRHVNDQHDPDDDDWCTGMSSGADSGHQPDSCDGFIRVELARAPVTYHICSWDRIDADRHMMAMMTVSRIACAAADVMRGRPVPTPIRRQLTETCLRKLVNVSALLDHHLRAHPKQRSNLRLSPAIPMLIYGTFVNDAVLDTVVELSLGANRYWANIVLRRTGGRWICHYADLGEVFGCRFAEPSYTSSGL